VAAERLREALGRLCVTADVHEGHDFALISVWAGLVVWTNGYWYRMWTGRISAKTGRRLHRIYGVDDPAVMARRVAQRCRELQTADPAPLPFAKGGSPM
jgi:hypothetical protein